MRFEWDDDKASDNEGRHGVSFHEAAEVFMDPNVIEFYDEDHSTPGEQRLKAIGLSSRRLLFVVFVEISDDCHRIIHARVADGKMEQLYVNQ